LNYSNGVCQGLIVGGDGAYDSFIIGYLLGRQGVFQLFAIIFKTPSSDAGITKILRRGVLVLEKM
jgi:hypothetical protein